MSLTWLAAIIFFILSIICLGWSLHHGVWGWQFLALFALLFWCLSGHPRAP